MKPNGVGGIAKRKQFSLRAHSSWCAQRAPMKPLSNTDRGSCGVGGSSRLLTETLCPRTYPAKRQKIALNYACRSRMEHFAFTSGYKPLGRKYQKLCAVTPRSLAHEAFRSVAWHCNCIPLRTYALSASHRAATACEHVITVIYQAVAGSGRRLLCKFSQIIGAWVFLS